MSVELWPEGYERIIFDEIDSTSAYAAQVGAALTVPTWILAHRQTMARGRRGRPWVMPEGNFAATLAMRPDAPPEKAALRSFVAALAVYDAISQVTGRTEGLSLKWPNDVLFHGGKVAGILLESTGTPPSLAIGIGVNLLDAPSEDEVEPEAVRPVSIRGETGALITPEEFLTPLAVAFAKHEAALSAFGFAPIRAAWLMRAARLGQEITARAGAAVYKGVFESIDETGALVLKTESGRETVAAAEVFFEGG